MINQSSYLVAKEKYLNQPRARYLDIEGIAYNMRPEPSTIFVHWFQPWLRQLAKRKPILDVYTLSGGNHEFQK